MSEPTADGNVPLGSATTINAPPGMSFVVEQDASGQNTIRLVSQSEADEQSKKKEEEEQKNRVLKLYEEHESFGGWKAFWSLVVLIVSSILISFHPDRPLLTISIMNLVMACIHLVLPFALRMKPKSSTDPAPTNTYANVIISLTIPWVAVIPASACGFFLAGRDSQISIYGSMPLLDAILFFAGILAGACSFAQCGSLGLLSTDKFSEEDIHEAYTKMNPKEGYGEVKDFDAQSLDTLIDDEAASTHSHDNCADAAV